jgi:DNA-binding NarL/FixJ family response regulator
MTPRRPWRPRRAGARGRGRRPEAWLRRVFRNTFTRNGRARQVRHWSFKAQFQGRRRTFSLPGRSRAAAAREARRLHQVLLRQGWEAAMALNREQLQPKAGPPAPAGAGRALKRDLDCWEQRLIQRSYREARLRKGPELSVRVERDGVYAFFPLGSNEPRLAAAAAREIDQAVLTQGWPAALERYEREITLAIFWSENPAAATYSTLFTMRREPPPPKAAASAENSPRKRVVVLEPDPTTHLCLRYWLNLQPGFDCPAIYHTAPEALAALSRGEDSLALVNRMAPDMARFVERLQRQRPGLPLFPYRIHEDSDQIWFCVSGVSGGYIYRRRAPVELFDPLQPAARIETLTSAEAKRHIHSYFGSFFGPPGAERLSLSPTVLTRREQEVLHHLSSGYLDKEIAGLLGLSIWTVHNHMKSIYDKLGVHNRTEAVLRYLQR